MRLADAARAEQDYVLAARDVLAAGEIQHQHLVERRDRLEVEALELFDDREPGLLDTPLDEAALGEQRRRLPPCLQRVEPLKAARQQPLVQDRQVMHLRDRHHEPAPCRLHQGLDLALVVALAGPAEAVAETGSAIAGG